MFFDDGKTVITEIFFPNQPWTEFSFAALEDFNIENFEAYELSFEEDNNKLTYQNDEKSL